MKRNFHVISILSFFLPMLVGSHTLAATYYASPSGSGTTCSEASPCTFEYAVETKATTSDTVLARGGTYTNVTTITVNKANLTIQNYPGESPIIDGQKVRPGGYWSNMVEFVSGSNGSTIDGLEIANSTGLGIKAFHASNITVRNCYVHHAGEFAILGEYAPNMLVEDCRIYWNGTVNEYGSVDPPETAWPGIVCFCRESHNSIARRNIIWNNWGEALSTFQRCDNILFEYNVVYDNWACQIYSNAARNVTIRYNLVYGTRNSTFYRGGQIFGGIYICNEPYFFDPQYRTGFYVYGNMVAGTNPLLYIGDWDATQVISDVYAYNNTLIEAWKNDANNEAIKIWMVGSNINIKNNIIWQTVGTIASLNSTPTFDYNLWSKQPVAAARGANDSAYAAPLTVKATGWGTLTAGAVTGAEFALQGNSRAINAGVPLDPEFSRIPDCKASDWMGKRVVIRDQNSQGSSWEIGAHIHVEGAYSSGGPARPTNIRIVN